MMYLVQLVHTMDDIPLRLFENEMAAKQFAREVEEMPSDKIRKVFKTDCSTPISVKLVTFNPAGEPILVRIAKHFGREKAST